ncbi:mannose-1-phosphate guanylyltransferase/mannose-6-phosphate isomerase [Desulfurispirillum indicum]|uniref:mannose-1-phosphate guanylyltransferase/mannose-6-phosphate isomerase n=1 Tax=Desulfurispirillum indicum TaxID=936456 RepID=UPI0001C44016|nr:mannose-1-phosphate guanylyltransferase/mannose-6-phosphate isomerase [Desulfurispirillum indicum]
MVNVILCGGSGTRLWPVSRALMPKQFVKLFGERSLFQLTVSRNAALCDRQCIVSNAEQYFLAVDQLHELDQTSGSYVLEPVGRNTAPAIALACLALAADELVLVTPSDHLVKDQRHYQQVLDKGQELARNGYLVTFGVQPTYAETGFGYIESGEGFTVKAFHEKPDLATAEEYLEKGSYYWNSGIFLFKAGVFLDELRSHSPKIHDACVKAFKNGIHGEIMRIRHEDMLDIPDDSIDCAVLEKSDRVRMVSAAMGWSDVGNFAALHDELPKDEHGNTLNDCHISVGSRNNFIYGRERKIATIDVENLIIVDTGDALLVSRKSSSQKVSQIVDRLRAQGNGLHNIHLTGHRPWGTFTVLEEARGYKIKKIEVKPGKRLSLQKHFHRNEHWIVVSGTATVTVGDEVRLVRPNESTYIKMGEIHRLSNEGRIPVVLIEAQVGEYIGEDDIVRLDDDFERTVAPSESS